MMIDMKLVQYCCEEVERQQARPIAVYWMLGAWERAMSDWSTAGIEKSRRSVHPGWIRGWGQRVDPVKNGAGWRQVQVWVGYHVPPIPELVQVAVLNLCEDINDGLGADEAYKRFQEIHPFVDGNGRTGKILYNFILGTLSDPKMPPNFWGIANP